MMFWRKSIWVIHNPVNRATWCSKSDCPKLARKEVFDIIMSESEENSDGELEQIIKLGVTSEADIDESKIERKVRRIGEPTVKHHALGVVAAFRSKKKALKFLDDYFKSNQDQSPDNLELTKISLTA
jgi:hypothetical protein